MKGEIMNMKGEIWKDIKGFEGKYMVSNLGRVKSLERMKWNGRGYQKVPEKIKKTHKDIWGYLYVTLSKEGINKHYKIHRLVCEAFISNPHNLPVINHKDENKENNCMENLEWCSYSYNLTYNGRAKKVGKKLSIPVYGINKVSGLIVIFSSSHEASRQLGINQGHIIECCQGKRKSEGGFYWFYADDNEE